MSDKQETTDDIIREMRDLAALDEKSGDMIPRSLQALGLRTYAARLEAAWKRERGALVAEAEAAKDARNRALVRLREEYAERCHECKEGNAAAMRRVLLNAKARFASLALTNSEWRTCAEEHVREIAAALVATTRNCDRFRTADEVSAYWGANVHAVPLHGDAYAMRIDGETYPTFLDWLFATAEGGEK